MPSNELTSKYALVATRPGQRRPEATSHGSGARLARTIRESRWPSIALFFLNGLTLSTFIVRTPALKAQHHLTDGEMGALGVLFAVAALAAMQFVGRLTRTVGSRVVLRVSLSTMPVALATVGLVGSRTGYAAAVAVLGGLHGTTDAAMNGHAVATERRLGRPVLNACHAAWSISAIAASAVTVLLARTDVASSVHLVVAAVVLLAGGLMLGPLLGRHSRDGAAPGDAAPDGVLRGGGAESGGTVEGHGPGWRHGWTRPVLLIGLTGTALMICEGGALGWGGIFVHEVRGASLGIAAAVVTAYTGGQTVGRLVGDRLTLRYGVEPAFRCGALVAAVGLAAALCVPGPVAAVAAFAVMGLGSSVLLPVAFGAVGRLGATSDAAVATIVSRFTTFTYGGILLGPAVIGVTAQVAGLTAALGALVPVLVMVGTLTRLTPAPATAP